MRKPPLFKSIAGRMLLLGVLPAMVIIALVVLLSALDASAHLRAAEERSLIAEVRGMSGELNARNLRWNSVTTTMAAAQVNGLFGQRVATLAFLHSVVESFRHVSGTLPLIVGAYVVYEPDADGNDAASLKSPDVPREAMDAAGRFLPYWFIDDQSGGTLQLKPNADMDTLEYYQGPKAAFARLGRAEPYITDPYVYEGVPMISYLHPIGIDGRFAGIVGVDRALATLDAVVLDMRSHFGTDIFVLGRDGDFIASTTDRAAPGADAALVTNVRDKPIAASIFAPLAATWTAAVGGDCVLANDPQLGEPCFYAVARVATGDWTVVARRTQSEVMAPANRALWRNAILGLIGLLLVGGLLDMAARRMARRVQKAVETADRIADGDLTRDVEAAGSGDETGMLLGAMGAMSGNLNGLAGSVRRASIQLNSTATEMSATARQQEASAASFGAASSEIAAAVKEISATSQDLVRTMDGVNTAAGETAALATSGRHGLEGMESVMRDLDRATASIAEKLAAINERSQKITTVVTTITRVADQTNILSINAAIEAEKAGEYGGGFLVIAREIRRLADQTAGATLDIEQMVQQMQAAVGAGVMEMDRFADQVRRGVRDVATVGSQLGEIIERVNSSTRSFQQVSESMQSQSEGAQQISGAMVQLTGTANQTMQSIHEFGRAAEDLQSAIASMREAVGKFRLKD